MIGESTARTRLCPRCANRCSRKMPRIVVIARPISHPQRFTPKWLKRDQSHRRNHELARIITRDSQSRQNLSGWVPCSLRL